MTDQYTDEPPMPPWPDAEDYPELRTSSTAKKEDAASAADKLRASLLHGAEVENIPAPEPLITDWLDLESLAVLYGRPNGGKSFMAIDMALCVATGSWWHGHEVVKGPVLYVAAEGRRGLGIRQRAWKANAKLYGDDLLADMHWLPRAVNLLDLVATSALTVICEELRPKLVVVDTLARSMAGGEENSGRDMGRVIDACAHLKERTGACVLLVHHTGKDQAAGARGHSSLLGAVDTELELKSAENILVLSTTKQKENAEQPPMRFTLIPAAESMAVARYTGRNIPDGGDLSSKHQITLDALASIDLGDGAASGQWQEVAGEQGIPKATFYRHRKALVDAGLVAQRGQRFSIVPPEIEDDLG